MKIQLFLECPELSAIRETNFYIRFRPYAHGRLIDKAGAYGRYIEENDEKKLTTNDRYFLKLDILLGQLFKNIKTRQFWKGCLNNLQHIEEVSCLCLESLDRAYLNELVVLFERLGRILVLIEKAFEEMVEVEDLKIYLLKFFNPMLFEKRNYTHHRMYLGFPGMIELNKLEEKVSDQKSFDYYYEHFKKNTSERINWIDYTEHEMATFLAKFLEHIHNRIVCRGEYLEPQYLPANFSCSDKLDVNFRQKFNHAKLYEEA